MSHPGLPDYRQHYQIETPEHVVLDYELAGVGSRALAALFDIVLVAVIIIAVLIVIAFLPGVLRRTGPVILGATLLIFWLYRTLFEAFRGGRTPGKRWLGIRVIRDTGHGITFAEAAGRNLLFPIDLIGMVGFILIALHPRARRLGDLVAGTIVVRDQPTVSTVSPARSEPQLPAGAEAGAPELADEEFRLLHEFIERAAALPAGVRDTFAIRLVTQLAPRYPDRPADNLLFLTTLHDLEVARRSGRFGGGGAAKRAVATRFVARKAARWNDFQLLADRVSRQGLDALSAPELPDFAARYREVAADLARARTYAAEPAVLLRLERLVAAGHNALYRVDQSSWENFWRITLRECPAAVLASWRYVALASLTFVIPALGGYGLLRARPRLADELLPAVMLERAEAGVARRHAGEGYVQMNAEDRPFVATEIITNNVRVAAGCFASGIAFGVGSLVMLAYNGLALGASSGHYANVGLLGYLWTFIIGHGTLELFAIWVAGAAGFLLGRALIAPGDMPRSDALTLASRGALRMVGASITILLVAGSIEGFVSASGASVVTRVLIGGISIVLLMLYLANGWAMRHDSALVSQ